MFQENTKKTDNVPEVPEDLPCISLIIPFEQKMNSKTGFQFVVNEAAAKIEKEIIKNYPEDKAMPVVQKLHRMLQDLDHTKHNQSIAIFVSPLIEKVYYYPYTKFEDTIYKSAIYNHDHAVFNSQLSGTRWHEEEPQNELSQVT
ncbi:MAG: hypothetical protein ABI472_04295 [Ginsengibacter sp.]